MTEKIHKNYFFSIILKGKVIARRYANSLKGIMAEKLKHPGCEVEVFDIKDYGFSFCEAPVVKVEGGTLHAIRCVDTGKTWRSAKECCAEIGIPLKTLYTAIRRGSRVYGHRYEYCKDKKNGEQ